MILTCDLDPFSGSGHAAARVGLKPSDVILKVQRKDIAGAADFAKEISNAGSETVRLQVQRGTHKGFVLLKQNE